MSAGVTAAFSVSFDSISPGTVGAWTARVTKLPYLVLNLFSLCSGSDRHGVEQRHRQSRRKALQLTFVLSLDR